MASVTAPMEDKALVYLPPLQRIFHTQAVDPRLWLGLAIWPVLVLGAEEARKAVFRRWVWPRTP